MVFKFRERFFPNSNFFWQIGKMSVFLAIEEEGFFANSWYNERNFSILPSKLKTK